MGYEVIDGDEATRNLLPYVVLNGRWLASLVPSLEVHSLMSNRAPEFGSIQLWIKPEVPGAVYP